MKISVCGYYCVCSVCASAERRYEGTRTTIRTRGPTRTDRMVRHVWEPRITYTIMVMHMGSDEIERRLFVSVQHLRLHA